MESLLAAPETKTLWEFFLELSRIPRGSKNEAAAADWVAEQGRSLGCEVERDAVGNVLIRKQATPGREGRPTTCLQAHVDMVCEKNEETPHDFTKDPIQVWRDGDLLTADRLRIAIDTEQGEVENGYLFLKQPNFHLRGARFAKTGKAVDTRVDAVLDIIEVSLVFIGDLFRDLTFSDLFNIACRNVQRVDE